MPRVIITGGPGAGKTTLLRELAARGYPTVDESARAVISERLAAGLTPRPPPTEFVREVLRRDVEKFRVSAGTTGWVFFDRGVIEALGMVQEVDPMPAGELNSKLTSYAMHPLVFVLPPWPEIYTTDAERDQDFEHAVSVHGRLARWYSSCHYELHEVPRLPVDARATHVLQTLGTSRACPFVRGEAHLARRRMLRHA